MQIWTCWSCKTENPITTKEILHNSSTDYPYSEGEPYTETIVESIRCRECGATPFLGPVIAKYRTFVPEKRK